MRDPDHQADHRRLDPSDRRKQPGRWWESSTPDEPPGWPPPKDSPLAVGHTADGSMGTTVTTDGRSVLDLGTEWGRGQDFATQGQVIADDVQDLVVVEVRLPGLGIGHPLAGALGLGLGLVLVLFLADGLGAELGLVQRDGVASLALDDLLDRGVALLELLANGPTLERDRAASWPSDRPEPGYRGREAGRRRGRTSGRSPSCLRRNRPGRRWRGCGCRAGRLGSRVLSPLTR